MKLFGFGDSYTEGHPEYFIPKHLAFEQWKKFRNGQLPLSWMELLGIKFNCEIHNYGHSGNGNQEIFEKFCIHSNEIEKDDIVLINWTYKTRFRWSTEDVYQIKNEPHNWDEKNREVYWVRLGPGPVYNEFTKKCISQKTNDEIVINRSSITYTDEVYNYEKLIIEYSKSKGFKVYFWSIDDTIINCLPFELRNKPQYICGEIINKVNDYVIYGSLIQEIINLGGETICDETKQIINDFHLGEKGHKIQTELFYDYVIKDTK